MTMAEFIDEFSEFEEWLGNTLDISDVESFKTEYPNVYAALLCAWRNEQEGAQNE